MSEPGYPDAFVGIVFVGCKVFSPGYPSSGPGVKTNDVAVDTPGVKETVIDPMAVLEPAVYVVDVGLGV